MSKYLKILFPLLIAVLLSLVPFLLKIKHWPGAGVISILKYVAWGGVIFYFLSLVNEGKKFLYPISLAVMLFFFGYIFKVLHWPGAGLLIVTSNAALIVLYSLRYLAKNSRTWLDNVKLISVLFSCASEFLFLYHWVDLPFHHRDYFIIIGAWMFILFLITYRRILDKD